MELFRVFDASTPPHEAPPGAEAVLGYVGRQRETPHVWSTEEWRPFAHLRQFPCWVPDTTDIPAKDAKMCIEAVRSLGWGEYKGADTRAIILDGETRQFPSWYAAWAAEIEADGFWPVDYGSAAYADANFAYSVWAADWDDIPALVPGQTVVGTQYKANVAFDGTAIDLSVISPAMFARGGIGARQ